MQVVVQDWQNEFATLQLRLQASEQEIAKLRQIVGDVSFAGSSSNAEKIAEVEQELKRLQSFTSECFRQCL